ncbi:adenylyltransferase/cytidyltransferase family protein [Engelhardtia mirabilis]|uniref:Bifunctional protein HldE n=1 Tax=Engelhardtia mirabilis TaxID=2528011 RepID=A0A518BPL2_9BACT|nr:Bifunctional protein HldE [Planctomycetes bacterium Pla133]QDV03249.1 Bifunctional protein HldE [Planctomycetes bacterium Pla86]
MSAELDPAAVPGARERVVDLQAARARVAHWRAAGERVVLANGCFELLHVGHLRYLCAARAQGERLVVALNSDESVRRLKGAGRPLTPWTERAELLASLVCVDLVLPFEDDTLEATLRALRPDVHAKGTDYTAETVPERHVDAELGIAIAICGDPKDHATTEIVARLAEGGA